MTIYQPYVAIYQLLSLLLFCWYVYSKHGILTSISSSTYYLGQRYERLLFLAVLWGMGISNQLIGLGAFGFFAGAGIIFTGMTMDHKKDDNTFEDELHTFGTIGGILLQFLGFIFLWEIYVTTILLLLIGGWIWLSPHTKNKIWWIEITALVLNSVSQMIYYIRCCL